MNESLNEEDLMIIQKLRLLHPEICHWGNQEIFLAWGMYSQHIWLLGWKYWNYEVRDIAFLAYMAVGYGRCDQVPEMNDDKISEIMNDAERVRFFIQRGINLALLKHKQTEIRFVNGKTIKSYE